MTDLKKSVVLLQESFFVVFRKKRMKNEVVLSRMSLKRWFLHITAFLPSIILEKSDYEVVKYCECSIIEKEDHICMSKKCLRFCAKNFSSPKAFYREKNDNKKYRTVQITMQNSKATYLEDSFINSLNLEQVCVEIWSQSSKYS